MEESLTLIERIIAEHKTIRQRMQTLEQVANDVEAIAGLEETKETFMPGRFAQHQNLGKLREDLETIRQGIQEHFEREETALLAVFEEYGDKELSSKLHSLLLEHDDLKSRFAQSGKQVDELAEGGSSRHLWEASANDMRAHLSHTRKLLEAHAEIEQELLYGLRERLSQKKEKGSL